MLTCRSIRLPLARQGAGRLLPRAPAPCIRLAQWGPCAELIEIFFNRGCWRIPSRAAAGAWADHRAGRGEHRIRHGVGLVAALSRLYAQPCAGDRDLHRRRSARSRCWCCWCWCTTRCPSSACGSRRSRRRRRPSALVSCAYTAEIFRAGIEAIPKGQFEAARAIGLNGSSTRCATWCCRRRCASSRRR